MTKYKVILSSNLDKMLLQHVRFISNVSVPAAKRFRNEFANIVQRLSENPFQFPVCEDTNLPKDTYRKAIFAKWYKAVFCIEDNVVYLDAVVDCRMDPSNAEWI